MEDTEELLSAVRVQEISNGQAAVVPDGYDIMNLAVLGEVPPRKAQTVAVLDIETLIDCVKREDEDACDRKSVIYVNDEKVVAVFNHYDSGSAPGWGDDTATMELHKTVEWDNWMGNSGRALCQKEFVEFIEENFNDIKSPNPADMLTIVSKFDMHRQVVFKSAYRSSDGETKVTYDESNNTKSGEIDLPTEFTIAIPVIRGAEKDTTYTIKVRLKVRLTNEGRLFFTYSLYRPDVPERSAVKDLSERIETALPENRVIRGAIECSTHSTFAN